MLHLDNVIGPLWRWVTAGSDFSELKYVYVVYAISSIFASL